MMNERTEIAQTVMRATPKRRRKYCSIDEPQERIGCYGIVGRRPKIAYTLCPCRAAPHDTISQSGSVKPLYPFGRVLAEADAEFVR